MNMRWLAAFTAFVGLLLIGHGVLAAWGISTARELPSEVVGDAQTKEQVDFALSLLPYLYLLTVQGIGLGVAGLACAFALIARRPWAIPALIGASGCLAVLALVAMVMVPQSWDTQVTYVALPALLWWQLLRNKGNHASAL